MSQLEFEASGKVKLPTQEELEKLDASAAILTFISGLAAGGNPYYVYIAVKPSLYLRFRAVIDAKQPVAVSDYGIVIAWGQEASPPPDVAERMRNDYGFDNEYEEKLLTSARDQQVAFMAKQEDKRIQDIVNMLKTKTVKEG